MELTEKPTTYYVKLEVGRHVAEDQGFYAIFNYKEITGGLERLNKSISVAFDSLKNYMEKRLVDGVQDKES